MSVNESLPINGKDPSQSPPSVNFSPAICVDKAKRPRMGFQKSQGPRLWHVSWAQLVEPKYNKEKEKVYCIKGKTERR